MRVKTTPNKKAIVKKETKHKAFPIIAIGASAGGLEAVTQLFQNLHVNTGMSFIYIQHLSPDYKSVLDLLSRLTQMKVIEAKNGMLINSNTVYVIPAGKEVNVIDNYIKLISPHKNGLPFVSGDSFFSSLAEQHKEQFNGIVLYGSANDGTCGLKSIKKQGGLTFAQNDSEKFMSKPISVYAEAILSTIHEPMVILDKNLRIKSANKSFYEKFQVNEGSTEGLLFYELGSKQWNIPRLRKLIEDAYFKGKGFEGFEVKLIFPKIGEKIMLLNAKRFSQSSHNEHLIILAMQDITEHTLNQIKEKEKEQLKKNILEYKKNNAALEKAVKERTKQIEEVSLALENKNHELESINKKLTSFTYISSHDLQEPLRKIQLLASHILEKEEQNLSEKGKDYFYRMQQAAKRMQTLIEDLLAYSHTNSEKVIFEKTDVNEILKEIKDEFEEELHSKNAKIEAQKLPVLKVIRFQFHQLLHNLISNALKFSDPKKSLQININSEIAAGNKFKNARLSAQKKYCHISISDNGIGFEPQFNDRIFEVFQRLHGKDEYKGTGIGLAICKKIVENHHGFITANGELKKGATFNIYLPVDLPQ